ncbi:Na/Pi cotransporter family protein [Roseobacter sp. YSTF-M11]|uniref:Na/Pi cotransporter family protein n=1 Tax=Roseobacter insulae TaxID=2859783 RepID=A0A9X1FWL2_9RHOB|nr:Na/Pi cotransporter family protein [Roseobacter insulae]MBW4709008.1 Na/Pi cotransporter family protein [Roseobacter insulae]
MIMLAAHLAAAVALLLWSVRLIRTGVERAFLPQLKRRLKTLAGNPISAASGGGLAAMLMQSSTAVALIGAGFAVSGILAPQAALALLLGADLGSALMAQVLVLPVQGVIPFALLTGIVTFLKASNRKIKQIGRIILGVALVLMSLEMIRTATLPIAGNEIVQAIGTYFEADLVSAYAVGALLAWVMHSSLVAVLTYAAFAAAGVIAGPVAAAMVIGANLGGALIPFVLLWSGERPARLVVAGNLVARGLVTVLMLLLLIGGVIDMTLLGAAAGQQAIVLHMLLNGVLIILALPFVGPLLRGIDGALPKHPQAMSDSVSALDRDAFDHAPLALACAQRELLRMAETVQAILVPVMHLFRGWDPELARVIERREDDIDRMHFDVKIYISQLRETELNDAEGKKTFDIVATANSLEEAADRIAVNLVALARKMHDGGLAFSDQGLADLEDFHDQVVSNGQLALSVLTTGDAEAARQLVAEKDRIRVEEQKLQERHLKRLQPGPSASLDTTNIHQESLRLLKQINAALSYVAYPIAKETGDLLDSRLARADGLGSRV